MSGTGYFNMDDAISGNGNVSGLMNLVHSKRLIKCNVHASDNNTIGLHNCVHGTANDVMGTNNFVKGMHNAVEGSDNLLAGTNSSIMGSNNSIGLMNLCT